MLTQRKGLGRAPEATEDEARRTAFGFTPSVPQPTLIVKERLSDLYQEAETLKRQGDYARYWQARVRFLLAQAEWYTTWRSQRLGEVVSDG